MKRNTVTLEQLKQMLAYAEFDRKDAADRARRLKNRIARRERNEARRACGLVKVKGALGGTYWECGACRDAAPGRCSSH